MTVSRLGGLSKIEVINSSQEITDKQLANIKSNLRNIRFRPKVVDGETVVSSQGLLSSKYLGKIDGRG